jgi:hypothetical protein
LRLRGGAIGAAVAVAACAAAEPNVVRLVDGRLVEGRYVDASAYAAYGAACLLEARGDDRGALELYEKALASDPNSVEILTRMAAIRCRLGRASAASEAFRRARIVDPRYAPRLREEARCLLRQRQPEQALGLALGAVALDPTDREASFVVAQAYGANGDHQSARRWIDGLAMFRPELDRTRMEPNGGQSQRTVERAAGAARRAVDRSLTAGRLAEARQLARRAGLEPADVAVRAVALGRADLGGQQAELVLGADPSSSDAWVAAVVAADLERDEPRFVRLLETLDPDAMSPGPLGSWLLAELFVRRVDSKAARAWLRARGQLGGAATGDDPVPNRDELESSVRARVVAELGGK